MRASFREPVVRAIRGRIRAIRGSVQQRSARADAGRVRFPRDTCGHETVSEGRPRIEETDRRRPTNGKREILERLRSPIASRLLRPVQRDQPASSASTNDFSLALTRRSPYSVVATFRGRRCWNKERTSVRSRSSATSLDANGLVR